MLSDSELISDNELIKRFKELRNKNGLTQSQIAEFLGVDESYISKCEKNEEQFCVSMLRKVAELFGCPVEYFVKESPKSKPMSVALKARSVNNVEDLKAVAAINKIALNLRFMEDLLKEE